MRINMFLAVGICAAAFANGDAYARHRAAAAAQEHNELWRTFAGHDMCYPGKRVSFGVDGNYTIHRDNGGVAVGSWKVHGSTITFSRTDFMQKNTYSVAGDSITEYTAGGGTYTPYRC